MAGARCRPALASATPARPRPNFFNAARRVTDWARLLVSSSNLLLIGFPSVLADPREVTVVRVWTSIGCYSLQQEKAGNLTPSACKRAGAAELLEARGEC